MKFTMNLLSLFFILFLLASISFAQERVYSINTSAGKLTVTSSAEELGCVIKIGRKVISNDETCDYSPQVLKQFKKSIPPFTEVLVFQNHITGNMCSGTDIFFIGFKENGEYELSDSIEYCGGPEPIVIVAAGKITVTLPRHKTNKGEVWIPKEVWIYEKGKLKILKQIRRKR